MTKLKNNIFGFVFGFIITFSIGVYAASTLSSSSVYYDNSTSGSTKTNVQTAIDDLYSKTKMISFKVGDYVSMTPTKTSFTVPKTLTGYTADQTINPSELNLWRVIRINSDNTVDMVSENISSKHIHIAGQIGYLNYVGTLNYIAKQYENPKYTVGSRHMGYNSQTEYLNSSNVDFSKAVWNTSTSGNTNETIGGGDTLYSTDTNLVQQATGTLKANYAGTTTPFYYWLASRAYIYTNSTAFYWYGRTVALDGSMHYGNIYVYIGYFNPDGIYRSIRPIVTLGTNISGTGSGTSASPYVLS